MRQYIGIFIILISAASFGAMAIFAKIVYSSGISVYSLLFYRFSLAVALMLPVAIMQKRIFPKGKDLLILIGMGLICYSGQSFCFFSGLQHIPAPLIAILLYLYPVIVAVLSVFLLNERITAMKFLALVSAVFGAFLVIGFETNGNIKGILFGIGAALFYSVYTICGAKVMSRNDPFTASIVVIASACFFYALINLKSGLFIPGDAVAWVNIVAISIICTAVAISTYFYGIKLAGALNAAMLSTFEPVTTMVLAALFLGQKIGWIQLIGACLVLASAVIVAWSAKGKKSVKEDDSKPAPLVGQSL